MFSKNEIVAPCDEATLTGFFSLKETKYNPIPKFKAESESATKRIFTLEEIINTSSFLMGMCEKKLSNSAMSIVSSVTGKNFISRIRFIETGDDLIFQKASASMLTMGYKNLNVIDEIKNELKMNTIK